MTRAIVATMIALGLFAGSQDPQQQVFRSGASAVVVDVSVRDASHRVVTDLKANDFTVLDNGVPQQVEELSYGKLPIDVTVGLDISGSVTGPLLDRLRTAIRQLMADLKKDDRLKLMIFNMRFSQTIDFTTDVTAIDRAIQTAGAAGGTALFDAVSVAMVTAADPGRRQLVVFFTDGTDTSSTTTGETLLKVAERSRATVSFVLLPTVTAGAASSSSAPPAGGSRTTEMAPGLLDSTGARTVTIVDTPIQHVANATGGVVLPIGSGVGTLGPTFLQVLDRFRSAYVLFYSPKGVDRSGFHTLTVTVNRPGAIVEARRGYFGG
jgi:VWFA-related protein